VREREREREREKEREKQRKKERERVSERERERESDKERKRKRERENHPSRSLCVQPSGGFSSRERAGLCSSLNPGTIIAGNATSYTNVRIV